MEGQFDLNVELRSSRDELTVVLRYAADLYEPTTVERFADTYVRCVEAAVTAPDSAVCDVPLVAADDLADLLRMGAGTDDW
jgi:hypothetical protein